ncbi:schlafen-like protein 1 isoform X2 [Patiria miniata]|uniref:Schlafen AlbA-2 domain-containing protein n=1 Tax=Patiria miniata TaxID=46514 RepID=A0A913ZM44_PATMI|nr:schlafen-like protein 1 isoform X2 [Patiria miniata]
MDMDHEEQFCVFFSNLEDQFPQSSLVTLIISFIFQITGILVSERDVALRHSEPCKCNTACVDLGDPDLQQRTVEAAQMSNSAPKGLVKRGRVLRVGYFQPPMLQVMQMPSPRLPLMRTGNAAAPKHKSSNGIPVTPQPSPPIYSRDLPRMHLVKNQRLGNETRILEFKRGGGEYIQKYMRRHLAKYICAFLNSEGGSLMIGVDDGGVVQGVCCDHKTEDNVRIMIDQVIHHFDPPVLPQMYRLDFIPVHDLCNTEPEPDLKVLEITVKAGRSNILYETPEGEAFIRRDGSVQGPLRAKDIQEWCHMKFSQEYQDKENTLRLQIDTLEVRLGKIERQQSYQACKAQESVDGTSIDALPTATLIRKNSPKTEDSTTTLGQFEHTNSLKRTNSRFCIIF